MGAVIAFIFALIALGMAVEIIKWIFKKIAIGTKTTLPLILLIFYVWMLIEHTSITLWLTGVAAVLFAIAVKVHRDEESKIEEKVLPLVETHDQAGLRKAYLAYTNHQRNILLNIIINSGFDHANSMADNIFRGDLLEVIKKNMNSKTGVCLMEHQEFASCFKDVWEDRIAQGIIQFAKERLPERFELDDSIEFQNQKNKDKITRLIKINMRQNKDPFEGAIDLD